MYDFHLPGFRGHLVASKGLQNTLLQLHMKWFRHELFTWVSGMINPKCIAVLDTQPKEAQEELYCITKLNHAQRPITALCQRKHLK